MPSSLFGRVFVFAFVVCISCGGGTGDGPAPPVTPGGGPDAGVSETADAAMPFPEIDALERYVILGDSLSGGSFPDRLYTRLAERYPGIDRQDEAHGGSEIGDVLDEQIPALHPHGGPVLVTLTIGGNDFKADPFAVIDEAASQSAAQQFEVDLTEAITRIEARYSGPLYILLANIYDPSDGEGLLHSREGLDGDVCNMLFLVDDLGQGQTAMTNLATWNLTHDRVAESFESVTLWDNHALFLGHALNASNPQIQHYHPQNPSVWLLPDCAHPNELGHTEIAEHLWSMITE